MRWVAFLGLCAVLGSYSPASTAKADGFSIGAAMTGTKYQHHKHQYHKPHYRSGDHAISCFEAAGRLWQQGYRSIEAHDCHGPTYGFLANSNLSRYEVEVSAKTGNITFLTPF